MTLGNAFVFGVAVLACGLPSLATQAQVSPGVYSIAAGIPGGTLYMRSGPGPEYPIVAPIPAGSPSVAVEQCRATAGGNIRVGWCQAKWKDYSGWISNCCLVRDTPSQSLPPPTPLTRRARAEQELLFVAPYADGDVVRALIEAGAPVDAKDDRGWTALAYATAAGNLEAAEALVDAGAVPFAADFANSPIVIAAVMGNASLVRPLARRGLPTRQINEAFAVSATRGDDFFVDALCAPLGVTPASVEGLRAVLEKRMRARLMPRGQIDSLFVLAALKYCSDQRIGDDKVCLTALDDAAFKGSYRIKSDVSEGILNMRIGPGVAHSLIAAIPAGSGGIARGECRLPDDGRGRIDWCRVRWKNFVGWVFSGDLVEASD